jgi:hypothetical protein
VALALFGLMSDRKRPTEADKTIDVIRGSEALGYEGAGREEHSGENPPREPNDSLDELADNQPEDLGK